MWGGLAWLIGSLDLFICYLKFQVRRAFLATKILDLGTQGLVFSGQGSESKGIKSVLRRGVHGTVLSLTDDLRYTGVRPNSQGALLLGERRVYPGERG